MENNKPSEILTTEEYMKLLGEVESIPPGVSVSEDDTHDTEELSKPPGEYFTFHSKNRIYFS